ncbi:OmpA family protein [uncultured Croceitalea sp.]|uniref:OmpA family protein n=1 Tax=uncultured Croceitalea sp. TaxID=1798908 RepID=UPI003305FFF0
MKMLPSSKLMLGLLTLFFVSTGTNAQFLKKLGKKAQKAAERTVERRVENETSKKTDQTLDSILEPGSGKKQAPPKNDPNAGNNPESNPTQTDSPNTNTSTNEEGSGPKTLEVYRKFDFVPGDKQLFFDNFSNDFVGDFPSKWNTNAGGEVVMLEGSDEKWFELKSGYNIYFIPDAPTLPEEYTIEFDILAVGMSKQTSSNATLAVYLSDDDKFEEGANFVQAHIPFCQYTPIGINIENRINNKREIYSTVKADIRDEILDKPHISIAVNKMRFRLWVNETKYIDVPRLVAPGAVLNTLKFHMNSFKDGEEKVLISNLKVAEGGVDLRRKLISEGKISTNGILFDSGSANIKAESMGIIRQISQVLLQEKSMNLQIVGHTDADGTDDGNLKLSKNRADAVKNALVNIYNISSDRLTIDGKGESVPVGDNATTEGKAQNRRVEFIKQ